MAEHELKTWPEFFQAIERGDKTFEARKNDRGFQRGDTLHLREWDPNRVAINRGYTGNAFTVKVTYVLSGFGIEPGYVVMGIKRMAARRDSNA
jgi:hypothetical protein